MKRRNKPDVMVILATLIALGVLTTGLVQGEIRDARISAITMTAQQ